MLQVGYDWPQAFHSLCLNFGRSLFPFAIFLVVMPSMLGVKPSFIRTLLDTSFFNYLSRISYSVYLVHGLVILQVNNVKKYDTYFSILDLYITSLAVILLSCFFGTILTFLLDIPTQKIVTKTFSSLRKTSPEVKNPGKVKLEEDKASESEELEKDKVCLLYTSPSPRDLSTSRMPSSA